MTQVAKVEKLLGREYAEISVARKTACGHDCENCGGCGSPAANWCMLWPKTIFMPVRAIR